MRTLILSLLCAVLANAAVVQRDNAVQNERVLFRDVPRGVSSNSSSAGAGHGLRIYGGDVASRRQFPYQAAIFIDLFDSFCGGSLIHKNWVLTAAHCVDPLMYYKRWAVYLGGSSMLEPQQEGRVVHVSYTAVRHRDYDDDTIVNDIGVIYLARGVELNEFVALSKLAPAGVNYAGRMATASGFGYVEDKGVATISPVLKYTSMPVVSSAVCYRYYYSKYYNPEPIDNSHICVEAKGTSSCAGDSGGPLTVKESDGSVVQIGLTSFGAQQGCTIGAPLGFTRVNIYYDWLYEQTGVNFP